jgi:hypothetical protein
MKLKTALAVLDDAREHGLSLGPELDPVSDHFYEAWRLVLRTETGGQVTLKSNLAGPQEILPWERETLLPLVTQALRRALEGSDLEVTGENKEDGT